MTAREVYSKRTELGLRPHLFLLAYMFNSQGAHLDITSSQPKAYPANWEQVADLRVFRATPKEWERLVSWRGDMKKKGWKLLRVTTTRGQLVAVFGRTRQELLSRTD